MFNAKPKFSKASKMPCRSWSLQALDTCPASIGTDGELVDACKGCYATDGNYRFSNVKAPRLHNRDDWQQTDWVNAMIAELDNDRYFRWFDSGDMYSLKLAEKIYAVMVATPWTRHWLPTRMHKFAKFADILAKMEALPNVVVRLSSDSINGDIIAGNTTSTIIPTISHRKPKMTICEAYEREGKCATCRACWDKDIEVVAYVAHGRKMAKQIKDLIQTVEVV